MHHRTRLAATALVGMLALAGCSAPASAPQAPADTAAPGGVTTPEAPAPVVVAPGSEVDADALLDSIAAASKGVKSAKTEITVTLGSGNEAVVTKMSSVTDSSDPDRIMGNLKMELAGQPIQVIMDGDDFYLRMELFGGQWIKMNRDEMADQGLESPEIADQTEQLIKLKGSVKKAVFVGEETINGVPARHYQLSLDPKALDPEGGQAGEDAIYELWLNDSDLPVKFRFSSSQANEKMVFEGLITGYNEPVEIKIPAASELMPEPQP